MYIQLEDGSEFKGHSFGYEAAVEGEVVFNTAMTGYPENLTDPSYCNQILVITYPLIGNYGVPNRSKTHEIYDFLESDHIQIAGLIVADYSQAYSHWNANESLGAWLKSNKVPALSGIDTRHLTKKLREQGTMLGRISPEKMASNTAFLSNTEVNLVEKVSCKQVMEYGSGELHIVLVDCGVKNNIIRSLVNRGVRVSRVPWNFDFNQLEYDGLFLTNGPGNPVNCTKTVQHIQLAIEKDKPIFGICLGNQLLALAAGAKTYKLKYGHRGHNQPVQKTGTQQCYITAQNHGYAVDDASLPSGWTRYFTNLNDQTNEGICHKDKPFFSVQFHPEAAGGPMDTTFLFDEFLTLVKKTKFG